MISYAELMVLVVYAAMAGYIMYLQHQLKKAHKAGEFLTRVLHAMSCSNVKIERTDDGEQCTRTTDHSHLCSGDGDGNI